MILRKFKSRNGKLIDTEKVYCDEGYNVTDIEIKYDERLLVWIAYSTPKYRYVRVLKEVCESLVEQK